MKLLLLLAFSWLWPFWSYAQGSLVTPMSYAQIDSLLALDDAPNRKADLLLHTQQKALEEYGVKDSLYWQYSLEYALVVEENKQYEELEELVVTLRSQKDDLLPLDLEQYYMEILRILIHVYQDVGRGNAAIKIQKEFNDLTADIYGEGSIEHHDVLIMLAQLNSDLNQFDKAERLLLAILSQQEKTLGSQSMDYAYTLFTLASLYGETEQPAKALRIQQQILPIIDAAMGKGSEPYLMTQANMSSSYYHLKQFDKAERLAVAIIKKQPSAIAFNNLGIMYLSMERYEEAEQQFRQSLNLLEQEQAGRGKTATITYKHLAEVYKEQGDFEKAVQAIRQSLWANSVFLSKEESQTQPIQTLVLKQRYSNVFLVSVSLSILDEIYASEYADTKELVVLKKRHNNLLLYARYVEKMTTGFQTAGDKLWQMYQSNDEYQRGLEVAKSLAEITGEEHWLEEALFYMESNKAALLGNAMKNNTAYTFGNVPKQYLEQGKTLRKETSILQKQLEEALLLEDQAQISASRKAIVSNDQAIQELTAYLEANYPAYYQYKYGSSIISIEEARAVLPNEQTAILEYYFGADSAYVMTITKKEVALVGLDLSSSALRVLVKDLRNHLVSYKTKGQSTEQMDVAYTLLAHAAYQKLVEPALVDKKYIRQLIVVPDNVLAQIPLEAFLTTAVAPTASYPNLPYLIRDYSIGYSYSLGLLTQNNRPIAKPAQSGILGFAPSYTGQTSPIASRSARHRALRKYISDLPAAQEELKTLEKQFDGHFLYKHKASETAFKTLAPQYPILHLAMHGIVNEHVPLLSSLIFAESKEEGEDNFLEAHEISHLELPAELVVLSACETGYGTFKQGEGIFSLARSFMYAGAPSMVVSLWTVNDYSTSVLMKAFYQELSNGTDKAKALRLAKLYYLDHNPGLLAHPNFWSPFVQMGNPRPIRLQEQDNGFWWMLLAVAGASLLTMAWWYLQSKKPSLG
ncbi:MAG: CHAT domain-containing protein [Aureispira sp.]